MKKILFIDKIINLIAGLFILLFVYTAISKFINLPQFRFALWESELTKPYFLFLAWAVPIVELIIGGLLFFKRTQTTGLILSALLMAAFFWYVLAVLSSDKKLPCTCGGVLQQMTWQQHAYFNFGFLLLAVVALCLGIHNRYQKQKRIAYT